MKRRVIFISIAVLIIFAANAVPVYAHQDAHGERIYVVQSGDTLTGIATRHGIGVCTLARANGLRCNSWVYVGQRLVIPGTGPVPVTAYIVRRGDTLYSIARRFGTTVNAIMQANGLTSTRIYVGQQLLIPGYRPGPVSVEGWVGRIVELPPGNQFGHCFERSDGERFGIRAVNEAVRRQIEEVRWTGAQMRVWGTLRTDVPSYAGRHITVESLEIIAGEAVEARNLTPFADVTASSYLRTDRWGQYQPWMAVDGRLGTAWVEGAAGPGAGEWIQLAFPGTVEIHSISLDVGYDLNTDIFSANNRIKRVTLVFSSGERVELGFADKRGVQTIPLVRSPGPNIETTYVKVIIEEVFPGSRYDDTCLAEIQVWGRTK